MSHFTRIALKAKASLNKLPIVYKKKEKKKKKLERKKIKHVFIPSLKTMVRKASANENSGYIYPAFYHIDTAHILHWTFCHCWHTYQLQGRLFI